MCGRRYGTRTRHGYTWHVHTREVTCTPATGTHTADTLATWAHMGTVHTHTRHTQTHTNAHPHTTQTPLHVSRRINKEDAKEMTVVMVGNTLRSSL